MKTKKARAWLWRAGTVLVLAAIAVAMFIVGRGHTVYFDNKTLEYGGQTYATPYKATVFVGGEEIAELFKRERGMAAWMGQNFRMTLEVTAEKGGEPVTYPFSLKLPYGTDGIVFNIPGLLAGLPPEAYRTEFVAQTPEAAPEETVAPEEELVPGDI